VCISVDSVDSVDGVDIVDIVDSVDISYTITYHSDQMILENENSPSKRRFISDSVISFVYVVYAVYAVYTHPRRRLAQKDNTRGRLFCVDKT
jgi:hypothetical protein